ncbi:MAG: SusC/RagA family protein, partial [Prevotella sp.]|nr:SusC/RagA family protein [Prevotella sp.]
TTDLLQSVIIPTGTMFAEQLWENMGSLENYGVEFTLDAKPIVTKDFTWDLSYNFGWNHNEITELRGGEGDDYYQWNTSNTISRGNSTYLQVQKVGEPMNSFFVYQQVYDKDGKPLEGVFVDRNGDGIISEADRYCYKSPAAPVTMGLTTKFTYKNWDLSASFRASIGNYVYYDNLSNNTYISATGLYSNNAFQNTTPDAVALGWSGIDATTGQQTQHWLSDYFVRNASFVKCQNITLGYTFSHLWGGEAGGRVFLTAQNPFIITKYDGLDPEVQSGIDKNPYPRPWSLQFGLNLNF